MQIVGMRASLFNESLGTVPARGVTGREAVQFRLRELSSAANRDQCPSHRRRALHCRARLPGQPSFAFARVVDEARRYRAFFPLGALDRS